MINTALQASNSVNGREKYFKTVNFGVVVAWPGGQRPHFLTGGSWSAGSNPRVATSILFFLSSYFYPLAFSLLTMLASRDFCENVFLV